MSQKIHKHLTYEQIGDKLKITAQQAHKIEKEAINKMYNSLVELKNYNPAEIIITLSEYLGVPCDQLIKKLNTINKNKLKEYMSELYEKKI